MSNSTDLLSSTLVYSKIMCVDAVYPIHMVFAYLVVLSGIAAFITRIKFKYLHSWFGLAFLVLMLWCSGTSLLIFNTGLPRFVIASFVIMLVSITIGILAIKIHQSRTTSSANPPNWMQRFFSWKAVHGLLMALAWYQMFGRLASTNPFQDWHGCYTWPAFKQLDSEGRVVLLPEKDPNFAIDNEAVFLSAIVVPVFLVFLLIGLGWSCLASRRTEPQTTEEDTEL